MDYNIPLIVITGTNASGKSTLGIQLAQKFNGEIISADSRQIFKGFDLCCGKVSLEERQTVVHHMLDICSVGDKYSVSDYQSQAYELIEKIYNAGKIPFIVGGTGLYIDAVVKGYDFKNEIKTDSNQAELENKSVSDLQRMLSPATYAQLSSNHSDFHNKRRLIRAIIKEKNGISIVPNNHPLKNVLQLGVTWPKEILYKRIDDRLATRIEQGMLSEVEDYLKNGGNPKNLYDLGLEYKYITWFLEGRYKNIDEFSSEMSKAIKRFAKRQMTWFKKNPSIKWIDMTNNPLLESTILIEEFLSAT